MPRVVYTNNEIIPAIVKQLAEPTVITIEGVEHTFIADSIAVICDDGQDDIAAALGHLAPQIQRPIISVGDYGFVKTLMSPLSAIGDDSPFGISFLKYSGLCSNDVSRALRVICGVYVDRAGVIVPLAAGTIVKSLVDGHDMKITADNFAPEMAAADVISYFKNIGGIARFNGEFARAFLAGKQFSILLENRNIYMFAELLNDNFRRNKGIKDAEVYSVPLGELRGEKMNCTCKYKYGRAYAYYTSDRQYELSCAGCISFRKNRIYAEVETGITLQMALDEYLSDHPASPQAAELVDIILDLCDGEIINWRGKLCLRGKKWFYHPSLMWALSRGIALDFPGYYWV